MLHWSGRFQPVTGGRTPQRKRLSASLEGIKGKYEAHHHVTITPEAVEAAVRLSSRYINDRNLPDKAIDLIDEAAASARLHAMDAPDKRQRRSRIRSGAGLGDGEGYPRGSFFAQMAEIKKKQDALVKKQERLLKKREKREEGKYFLSIGENEIAECGGAQVDQKSRRRSWQRRKARLLKLEKTLHKRVIGSEEAVTAVAKAIAQRPWD